MAVIFGNRTDPPQVLRHPFFPSADNDPSDDMPIIAVMVALSSLLVIIFIIIILYMLRLVKRADVTHYILHTSQRPLVKA